MIYFNNDRLLIRSMMKSDIQRLVDGFAEQNWHKPDQLFINYYQQQKNNERLVIVAEIEGNVAGYVTLLPYTESGPFAHKQIH